MTVYTLFGQTGGGTIVSDGSTYTMGMQFTLSQPATLTGIWFYSAPTATALPAGCAIFQQTGAGTGTVVAGSRNDTPSWSGAAGSGWVKCTYASGPVLAAATIYKVVIEKDSSSLEYSATSHYWDSGPGASGLTSGIITAPNNAGADGGQDTFVTGSPWPAYPATSFNAANYWIDVEVTTSGGTPSVVQVNAPVRIKPALPPRGRVSGNPGARVQNPHAGPVFRQAGWPARTRIPQNTPRGRATGSAGAPVQNPPPSPALPFSPFRQAVHIRFTLPPRGRVTSGPGAPARNPARGPVFTQAIQPARARIPQNAPRGRTFSSPAAPAASIHRILITAGDPFTTWTTGSIFTFQP